MTNLIIAMLIATPLIWLISLTKDTNEKQQ